MAKVNEKDIEKRWNERVVPNGWQNEGKSGASSYLMKYGKKISNEKLQGFADYARKMGHEEFARYMEAAQVAPSVKPTMKEVTVEYAERHNFNGDIIDMYNDHKDSRKLRIVETTVGMLASLGVGSCCGDVPNQCFKKIAEKYPNVKVRGCLDETCDGGEGIVMSAVDMLVKDEAMGEEISELASEGGGSYRFDGDGVENDWAYFETE